jgi:hypothetical protein
MRAKRAGRIAVLIAVIGMASALSAQQAQTPLTNADVVKMVKAGLSESIVVATIQANPGKYDTSPDALIALHNAGVTKAEMDALMAPSAQGSSSNPAPAAPPTANGNAPAAATPHWQMPTVTLLQDAGPQEMPREKTQLAQTKTKPQSLASLAKDSAVTQGIGAGVSDVTYSAASHMTSGVGGSAVEQAGGIFSGMMAHRQQTATYVWGVPGPASSNVLGTTTPKFSVNFANAPGVNATDFAPKIVRLTPAQNTCRLVGATRGKEDARSSDAADWEIYSGFVEDSVAANVQKTAEGRYEVSPQAPLYPGEYAVVLRPVSTNEKFSGGEVSRGQGPGMMFNTLWTFQVAESAQ